jgi:hypothetical protein
LLLAIVIGALAPHLERHTGRAAELRIARCELTEEELLADQAFSVFRSPCANLSNKIQLKIIAHTGDPASGSNTRRL